MLSRAMTVAACKSERSPTATPADAGGPISASAPAHADRGSSANASDMEPRSLGIDKHRRYDLNSDIAVAHRIIGAHILADALGSPPEQPKTDPRSGMRRISDRG